MEEKKVVIRIKRDGSVTSEAFGFKGPECVEKSAFLKKAFKQDKVFHKPSYAEESIEDKSRICDGLPSGFCG